MVDKKNILVTGSNGQLGNSIRKVSNEFDLYNLYYKDKNKLDVSNYILLEKYINDYEIDIIINCAAFTNVEAAEINREVSDKINHIALDNLSRICYENEIQLIHISTDFVFDGLKSVPYTELDNPNPINYYGLTKLNGERKMLNYDLNKSIIIRTSWLYSDLQNNFVSKILDKISFQENINVVDNEFGSPTNAKDLAITILTIIPNLKNNKTQVYHFSNTGMCSRYDLANEINKITEQGAIITPISNSDANAKRPKFSALDSTKIIRKFDLKIKNWKESLLDHIEERYINKSSRYEA